MGKTLMALPFSETNTVICKIYNYKPICTHTHTFIFIHLNVKRMRISIDHIYFCTTCNEALWEN